MRVEILNEHAVDVIRRELDDNDMAEIAAALAWLDIQVRPVVDDFHTLHLWAQTPTTTVQAVRAVASFRRCTDCRIAWHGAVESS